MQAVHRGAFPERCGKDLNFTQEKILLILGDYDQMRMQILSRKVNMDRGAFSRVIQSLVEAGLVSRHTDELDRRSVILKISNLGKKHLTKLKPKLAEHFNEKFAVLSERQKQTFLDALYTLNSIVELIEGDNQ